MLTPCIKWPGGHRKHDGRPMLRKQYAYRAVYELACGPLPEGVVLHHVCDNAACVNLTHLEPMTQAEHMRLHPENSGDKFQADKTHCPAGHAYTEDNTYRWRNERHCKTCRRETKRRLRANSAEKFAF